MDVTNGTGQSISSINTDTTYIFDCYGVRYDTVSNATSIMQSLLDTWMPSNDTKTNIPDLPKEKEKEDMQRVTIPMPVKMLRNGRATVVFFADDTKVVVKLPEGEADNEYSAFCAAITKKMFGTNTRIKRKMEDIREVTPTAEEKKIALEKAREEAAAKQQAEVDRKVQRMAHEIVLEKRAKQLAKTMMEGDA